MRTGTSAGAAEEEDEEDEAVAFRGAASLPTAALDAGRRISQTAWKRTEAKVVKEGISKT